MVEKTPARETAGASEVNVSKDCLLVEYATIGVPSLIKTSKSKKRQPRPKRYLTISRFMYLPVYALSDEDLTQKLRIALSSDAKNIVFTILAPFLESSILFNSLLWYELDVSTNVGGPVSGFLSRFDTIVL